MSLLTSLFESDKIKDMALGILKKTMNENSIKFVVIEKQPDGTLDMKMYKEEQQPVVMGVEQMGAIELAMSKLSQHAEHLEDENARLVQVCKEQEKTISEMHGNPEPVFPGTAQGAVSAAKHAYDNLLNQSNGTSTETP